MRNAIFVALSSILILILANFAFGATSEETSGAASVTVNEFVDITLTDTAGGGFSFGGLDPGTINKNESDQVDGLASTTGAATVTRQTTSNVDVKVRLKGTNFIVGSNTLPITYVTYDDDGEVDVFPDTTQANLTTAYPGAAYATLTGASPDLKIWFWLDVPTGQAAGSYSSTFSFEGKST